MGEGAVEDEEEEGGGGGGGVSSATAKRDANARATKTTTLILIDPKFSYYKNYNIFRYKHKAFFFRFRRHFFANSCGLSFQAPAGVAR
jgi:hypothetical protein